jgi:hypothetical protein
MKNCLKKIIVIGIIILSISNSNKGLAQYIVKTSKQIPNELIIGYWRMNQNPDETICISRDSLCYFFKNKKDDGFNFEIVDSVFYREKMIKPRKGEKVFVLRDKGEVFEVDFLLGINKNEFSLMSVSNGQTAVYTRIKIKSKCCQY